MVAGDLRRGRRVAVAGADLGALSASLSCPKAGYGAHLRRQAEARPNAMSGQSCRAIEKVSGATIPESPALGRLHRRSGDRIARADRLGEAANS